MNLLCLIFGHKKIVRNWYPTDPITSLGCTRCRKTLDQRPNPGYIADWYYSGLRQTFKRVFSANDPYGEEIWDE